jgi:hypothetical protein
VLEFAQSCDEPPQATEGEECKGGRISVVELRNQPE